MTTLIPETTIDRHYGRGDIMSKIMQALEKLGLDADSLTVDDLAPVDEFHTRGRASTDELASLSTLSADDRVLDVGCGLGGSARHLANTRNCSVTGVDLTAEYIAAARELTERVGMQDCVRFQCGSALELPFDDDSFHVAWTEHAQMNISDMDQFYSEIARVLKPDGRFLFHDVFAGHSVPLFPVPWAEDESMSCLTTEDEALASMRRSKLNVDTWRDKSDESLQFFEAVLEKIKANGPPPLGIHLLMGDTARQKIMNYVQSLREGRVAVGLGMATRS